VLAGTQQGFCEDFDIELSIEGDLPVGEIETLTQLAHRMCFTEYVLSHEIKITSRNIYNGKTIEPK